jgi:hypothetical protein
MSREITRISSVTLRAVDGIPDDELEAIEGRATAATPGAWWSWIEGRDGTSGDTFIGRGTDGARHPDLYLSTDLGATVTPEDLDFIASARQDVPRLVAEVRRLRALLGA